MAVACGARRDDPESLNESFCEAIQSASLLRNARNPASPSICSFFQDPQSQYSLSKKATCLIQSFLGFQSVADALDSVDHALNSVVDAP